MDKIQAAIAKARAAREEITGDAKASQRHSYIASRRRALNKEHDVAMADRAAIWQPLATFAPPAKQMAKHRVVTFETGPQSDQGVMAFDKLRTKVLQEMRINGWRRLAITSPSADCGKTTVSMNLAFSLAKQPEIFTVVAEMDMRRPSMASIFGLSGETGFSAVLGGEAAFADIAKRPRPNVAFGLNYTRTRNPAELLQSSSVGRALADIEEQFAPDLTIFDMPPMLSSDDTMAFMGQVDCVLLVAAAEATSIGEIDVCERDLASQTNVMGVLLNKCRYMDKESGNVDAYY
ncbi:Mrp family chromosome partitioning ATPase [Loktanella sp. PT4BL]|jgi:Mrp family chromosome partitioning ATPase|uniref:CpsD/CapB family tyrosine-protein kinase n=1 Tax=Rhodobacterales TaxID=204455 RepID=UPI000D8B54CD|nr:CpsD/CapB family tyrosine-protein kinase [Loktanella sp. PT4BL]PXW72230.1 Mrp family chromosome partitioning ATPase [Loktanella sp. PT4BL]